MTSNAELLAEAAQRGAVSLQLACIILPGGCGIDKHRPSGFHVLEHGSGSEIEGQFGGIKQLENDYLMAASREGDQVGLEPLDGFWVAELLQG